MIIYNSKNVYHPLKSTLMEIIEETRDSYEKSDCIRSILFNTEYDGLKGDEIFDEKSYMRLSENIPFMKEFTIPAKWFDESIMLPRRAAYFVRAYYLVQNTLCELALMNGEKTEMSYNREKINISLPSGEALFSKAHKWGEEGKACGVQSNYFCCSFSGSEEEFLKALRRLCGALKNMKDEEGKPLGYAADTIIIPCNQTMFHEQVLRTLCKKDFRGFRLVVLPGWRTDEPRFMIMSRKANKELSGNMFFNRVPLVISNWVDSHTGNYIWNGRCRFGVGFGSYKHILLAVDSKEETDGATPIE